MINHILHITPSFAFRKCRNRYGNRLFSVRITCAEQQFSSSSYNQYLTCFIRAVFDVRGKEKKIVSLLNKYTIQICISVCVPTIGLSKISNLRQRFKTDFLFIHRKCVGFIFLRLMLHIQNIKCLQCLDIFIIHTYTQLHRVYVRLGSSSKYGEKND